jgi:RNA polymerase-interacting CarD/CdnL/TRCF family regulator
MQKYTDDTTQLMSEKDLLKQEYEKLKSELSNKLNTSETEVSEFIEFIR